jgi:hypothetical protein
MQARQGGCNRILQKRTSGRVSSVGDTTRGQPKPFTSVTLR